MPRFLPCGIKSNSRITPSRSIQINLKLVIRISDGKVLFAQGAKDFVEFLLSFLTFPLGGVARVLAGNCSLGSTVDLGSVDELYKSIANLNEKYLTSKEVKNRLIDPRPALHPKLSNLILPIYEPRYRCYYQRSSFVESLNHNDLYITEEDKGNGRFVQMSLVNPELSAAPEGVKGGATYIATDDLVITPASPISIVYLINRLGTPLSDLKEKSVTLGLKEVREFNLSLTVVDTSCYVYLKLVCTIAE
ncbi:uncharacterized protein LOC130729268 [Lotus japonicus]|uniref:uncharacterized protein LOC130729268 n=1 Tax=Lotus japonicus TaxID=34305 RepID=UPI00258C6ADC|nr:uncharacterized protein LOC130729268 [Lotus japonicus]